MVLSQSRDPTELRLGLDKEAWWKQVASNPHMIWCLRVAGLAVDELATVGIIPWSDFERAKKIVAEEVFVRLCANDLPPEGSP